MTGRRHQSTGLSGRWLMVVVAMARDGMGWDGMGWDWRSESKVWESRRTLLGSKDGRFRELGRELSSRSFLGCRCGRV